MGFLPQEAVDQIEAWRGGHAVASERVKPRRGEEIFTGEAADYPRTFRDFVGQDPAKEQLTVKIASAIAREARLDHALFATGEHGIGKTTLAHLVAYQMGVGLIVTAGKGLSAEEFRTLAMSCEDRDVVFVDEFHMVFDGGKNRADWLLPWMLGGGLKTARGVEKTPDVTLMAATTDPSKAPETLLSRFVNTPEFGAYTAEEGASLVGNLANRLNVDLDPDPWDDVARAANNNPRTIRNILTHVRDLSHAWPETHPNLAKAITYAGMTPDGLTRTARNMLIVLYVKPSRTASIDTLAGELGEPGSLRYHERLLTARGLLEITGQGRRLTPKGAHRALQAFEEV